MVLGEALAGIKRETYVLATRLFFPMNGTDRGLSRKQVQKQLEASLKRLRVRPEQLNENAAASGTHVDPSLFTEAERLLPNH